MVLIEWKASSEAFSFFTTHLHISSVYIHDRLVWRFIMIEDKESNMIYYQKRTERC